MITKHARNIFIVLFFFMAVMVRGASPEAHAWLNHWSFGDTNAWLSDRSNPPLSFTNLNASQLGNGKALLLDTNIAAWLRYKSVESDGTNNLKVDRGSIVFWFAPAWAGTNKDGVGPQQWGRLIEVGSYTTNASYGWWSVYVDPEGVNLRFAAQTNGQETLYLSAPIEWRTNKWHFIALTYSHTNSSLYLDGQLLTNGLPVTNWPGTNVLSQGFYIGSDSNGLAQARGMYDDVSTYDFPLSASAVHGVFQASYPLYWGNPNNPGNFSIGSAPSSPTFLPVFNAITGSGYLVALTNAENCFTNADIWFTNVVADFASADTMQLTFDLVGGSENVLYDVFAISPLTFSPDTAWAWMGQGYSCMKYALTNLPDSTAFLILGQPVDSDFDGLSDAYEKLVSKTDPNNPDTDYDGRSDGWEIVDETDPLNATSVANVLLGFWRFDNTTNWVGEQGQLPLTATNLLATFSWSSNAVQVNHVNPAILKYRDVEPYGNANINLRNGTVRFWFRPGWASQTNGAGPTNEVRLIEMGTKVATNGNGYWGLLMNSAGTEISFISTTNSAVATNFTAAISWTDYDWHQIVLTYSSNNSSLYIDGQGVKTNGSGVTSYPNLSVRTNGFRIGSSVGGTNQAHGSFENLETYNYVISAETVAEEYEPPCYPLADVMMVIDISNSMTNVLSGSLTRIVAAKAAASNFVANLKLSVDKAGLISFWSSSAKNQQLTTNLTATITAITNLTTSFGTRIDFGITNAQAELQSARHNPAALPVMVVLSDGENTAGTEANVYVTASAAKAAHTRLITIALTDEAGTNLMKAIASSTNDYYFVTNSSQLDDAFDSIRSSICRDEAFTVTITHPTNSQLFVISPTNIFLTAVVSNNAGTSANVRFFNGTNLLGSGALGAGNIYSLLWTNVGAGTNSITAVATNDLGQTALHEIVITNNHMPVVSINSPTNLQTFVEAANVTNTVTVSDADGTITKVEFYSGATLVGSNTVAPFSFVWASRYADSYPITAVAIDNRGARSASNIRVFKVTPTNQPPSVAITFPSSNTTNRAGANITITANAAGTNGSVVTNVEFFVNGRLLGNDSTNPYSITECCWKPGTYELVARATDNLGSSRISASVTNVVVSTEMPAGNGFWDVEFGLGVLDSFWAECDSCNQVGTFASSQNHALFGYGAYTGWITKLSTDSTNWSFSGLPALWGYSENWHVIFPDGTNAYFAGLVAGSLRDYTYVGNTNVLRWDGSTLHAVGNGLNIYSNCEVRVIAKIGAELYIGGSFTSAGPPDNPDTNVQYIAKLDAVNNRWMSVGNGFPVQNQHGAGVNAIAAIGSDIFIAGSFTNAGGNSNANYVARLAGNTWTNLGAGIEIPDGLEGGGVPPYYGSSSPVTSLAVCGTNLFVGGRFQTVAGNTNANGIAVWNTVEWRTIGRGLGPRPNPSDGSVLVNTVSVRGNRVFVGGFFTNTFNGSTMVRANHIASALWSEDDQVWTWSDLDIGASGLYGAVYGSVWGSVVVEGDLPNQYDVYFWGDFDTVGRSEIQSPGLARWRVGYPQPAGLPTVIITNPPNSAIFTNTDPINIAATASSYTNIDSIQYFADGQPIGFGNPTTFEWLTPSFGPHLLTAAATDANGLKGESSGLSRV